MVNESSKNKHLSELNEGRLMIEYLAGISLSVHTGGKYKEFHFKEKRQ